MPMQKRAEEKKADAGNKGGKEKNNKRKGRKKREKKEETPVSIEYTRLYYTCGDGDGMDENRK